MSTDGGGLRPADVAWLTLAAAVAVYELAAPAEELLSEAVDRYRTRHPVIIHAAIVYLAGHLTRVWPRHLDPLCLVARLAAR